MSIVAQHYYPEEEEKLLDEYALFKHHMASLHVGKLGASTSRRNLTEETPTEACLKHLAKLGDMLMFPLLSSVAEAILSLNLSNAWPERGASCVKRLKTRLRSRLSSRMLETLLHIVVNGPKPGTTECEKIIKLSVARWYGLRQREKAAKTARLNRNVSQGKPAEAAQGADPNAACSGLEIADVAVVQENQSADDHPDQDPEPVDMHVILDQLNIPSEECTPTDSDSDYESDFDES